MSINIKLNKQNCNHIIVKKTSLKLAVHRNKIRRRIRNVLIKYNITSYIKLYYNYSELRSFKTISYEILRELERLGIPYNNCL